MHSSFPCVPDSSSQNICTAKASEAKMHFAADLNSSPAFLKRGFPSRHRSLTVLSTIFVLVIVLHRVPHCTKLPLQWLQSSQSSQRPEHINQGTDRAASNRTIFDQVTKAAYAFRGVFPGHVTCRTTINDPVPTWWPIAPLLGLDCVRDTPSIFQPVHHALLAYLNAPIFFEDVELQPASTSPFLSPFVAHAHRTTKDTRLGNLFYFDKLQRKMQSCTRAYASINTNTPHTCTHTHLSSRPCPHLRMPVTTAAICPTCLLRTASPDARNTAHPSGEHRGCRSERGHHHGRRAAFTLRHVPKRLPPAFDDRGQGEAAADEQNEQ